MPVLTMSKNFDFERMLKHLLPYIDEDQAKIMQKWNFAYDAYNASWALMNVYSSVKNAFDAKAKSEMLLALEGELSDTISTIFLDAPDVEESSGNWDAGREAGIIVAREETIIAINQLVCERYTDIRTQMENIDEVLSLASTDDIADLDNDIPDAGQEETMVVKVNGNGLDKDACGGARNNGISAEDYDDLFEE